jgi:hypothetical protein
MKNLIASQKQGGGDKERAHRVLRGWTPSEVGE